MGEVGVWGVGWVAEDAGRGLGFVEGGGGGFMVPGVDPIPEGEGGGSLESKGSAI